MNKDIPVPGQRWTSDTEPELGLGIVLKSEYGRAEIFFPAAGEHRQYALASAPIRRVRFSEGDKIRTHSGEPLTVDSIVDTAGLLSYNCGGRAVAEAELSDSISFSKPEEDLLRAVLHAERVDQRQGPKIGLGRPLKYQLIAEQGGGFRSRAVFLKRSFGQCVETRHLRLSEVGDGCQRASDYECDLHVWNGLI